MNVNPLSNKVIYVILTSGFTVTPLSSERREQGILIKCKKFYTYKKENK